MKTIPLTKDKEAVVDDRDYETLSKFSWYVICPKGIWYARRTVHLENGKYNFVYMHRAIMGNPKGKVDHQDGDGLNNRRSNLRPASVSQNSWNASKQKGRSSKYKGVTFRQKRKYWEANICKGNKRRFLGRFESEISAAEAYDSAAKILFGVFARLNFPIVSGGNIPHLLGTA